MRCRLGFSFGAFCFLPTLLSSWTWSACIPLSKTLLNWSKESSCRLRCKQWSSAVLPTATPYSMSNVNEVANFATFYHMYKQLESKNQRLEGIQPQHPTTQAHRPPPQRLSPARLRPQPCRQTPLRNASESTTFFRTFDELKKRLDDIYAVLNNLRDMWAFQSTIGDWLIPNTGQNKSSCMLHLPFEIPALWQFDPGRSKKIWQ